MSNTLHKYVWYFCDSPYRDFMLVYIRISTRSPKFCMILENHVFAGVIHFNVKAKKITNSATDFKSKSKIWSLWDLMMETTLVLKDFE